MREKITIFLILTFVLGLSPVNFADAITQNQINAEVQIVCLFEDNGVWQKSGSGTMIDPKGIILTNEHVVTDLYGNTIDTCFVGFTESINQAPSFGTTDNPNFAKVKYTTTTADMDAAILYLDNPANKNYPYVNIWNSNSDALKFGDKIEVIGFPEVGGSTITYTSGDFSGFGSQSDGTQNYIKTTAWLGHGNSGGASYNSQGLFIGIPTMGITKNGDSMKYLLSVNSIKNWLSGFLGTNYQQEVIEQKPIIEKPTISIQSDITPPNISGTIVTGQLSRLSTNSIYFIWDPKSIYEPSGIKGYYIYFGRNVNATPETDGQFTTLHGMDFTMTDNDIYYFMMQAVDNYGNISGKLVYEYDFTPEKNSEWPAINSVKIKGTDQYFKKDQYNKDGNAIIAGGKEYELSWSYEPKDNFESYIVDLNDGGPFSIEHSMEVKENKINTQTLRYDFNHALGVAIKSNNGFVSPFVHILSITTLPKEADYDAYLLPYQQTKLNPASIDTALANRLKGQILLQVEAKGEAYYIYPNDSKKYYLGRPKDAFEVMRKLGLGATHDFITSHKVYPLHISGKILLDVEQNGEAYYIYPKDRKAYYLGRPADAFRIMRELGLGITNNDISKIKVGVLE